MSITQRNRACFAGIVWVLAGAMLLVRGFPYWLTFLDASTVWGIAVLGLSLAGGVGKGVFVLRKTSARMLKRIETRPGPRPFWEMYPLYFYPLVGAMITGGILLRHYCGEDQPWLVAVVYLAVGSALLMSAGPYFRAAKTL